MANPTQLWPGERMRRFFRAIFAADHQVDDALADRLAQSTMRYVNRMLVLDGEPVVPAAPADPSSAPIAAGKKPAAKKKSKTRTGEARKSGKSKASAKRDQSPTQDLDAGAIETEAGVPWIAPDEHDGQTADPSQPPAFDPFAFSAVVVLARQGAKGLHTLLAEIERPEHLRQLAEAQHLGVDRKLSKADDLREAIVKGAAQRIADRRAAAS